MSRLALELERQVNEMRAAERRKPGRKATKEGRVQETDSNDGNQLTGDEGSVMTDTNLSQHQEGAQEALVGNEADGANGNMAKGRKPTVAKKKASGAKKVKPAKAAKAPKAAKAAKVAGERKPREKKVASGKLKKIEASGTTYLTLEFEEGSITLTPTGNREQNRDIAVKALRALL